MERFLLLPDRDRLVAVFLALVPRVLAATAIILLFWVGLRLTRPALRSILNRARFAPALITLLVDGLLKGAVVFLAVVMAASQLGINVGAALAGIGVVGIAVGFAAQETIANTIAGFLIFWDRPFKVGDFITTLDKYGEVREITMRTTRIRTMENTYVVIPNKQIMGDMLVNHSLYGEVRVNVPVGIAYKEQIAEARAVLVPAAMRVSGVLADPAVDVVACGLADSSVNLQVRVWTDDPSQERRIFAEVLEASKAALDQAGIQIPYPHLQLFVDEVSDRVWAGASHLAGRGARAG